MEVDGSELPDLMWFCYANRLDIKPEDAYGMTGAVRALTPVCRIELQQQ